MDAAGTYLADTLTFHMLASFPYTTAIFFALFLWMCSRSVSFNSSATKPIKELSGVCAASVRKRWFMEMFLSPNCTTSIYNALPNIFFGFLAILIMIDYFKSSCHQMKKLYVSASSTNLTLLLNIFAMRACELQETAVGARNKTK